MSKVLKIDKEKDQDHERKIIKNVCKKLKKNKNSCLDKRNKLLMISDIFLMVHLSNFIYLY